jgi:hypothetical protein
MTILHPKKDSNPQNDTTRRNIMESTRTEDYFTDDNEGHVDTRARNHECEKPDPHLGCDLGIDVAG